MPTLYEILGIKEDANKQEIRAAYKKLSVLYHPDKHHGKNIVLDKYLLAFILFF